VNLYHISQQVNNGYDTYDSAVVAAETAEQAKCMHPDSRMIWDAKGSLGGVGEHCHWKVIDENGKVRWESGRHNSWAPTPASVTVRLIGVAVEGTEAGAICASFNAS